MVSLLVFMYKFVCLIIGVSKVVFVLIDLDKDLFSFVNGCNCWVLLKCLMRMLLLVLM